MQNQSHWNRAALYLALAGAGLTLARPLQAQNALTSISAVQGSGDTSPLLGKTVTIEGIVTGDYQEKDQFSGFFVQDPQGDGDAATSDGVFVYLNSKSPAAGVAVQSGDRVRVTGNVEEYVPRPSNNARTEDAPPAAPQTQIGRTTSVEVLGHGDLPAPVPIMLPLPDGVTMERFEGMRVTFPQKLVVTGQYELARLGSITLSYPARLFVPTNQAPLGQMADDADRRSIALDDGLDKERPKLVPYLDAQGTRRTGAMVSDLTGILTYVAGAYRLEPTTTPVFEETNPRPAAPPAVGGTLKIAAANVHNFWTTLNDAAHPDARGAKTAAQFARQRAKTAAELKGLDADVIGLMELENNGPTAIDALVSGLNEAYGATVYAKVPDPPQGAGPGHSPIKVGLIYKPARVSPRGASLADANPAFDRYPLAQTFVAKENGAVFTVVVNHFKSKRGGETAGDPDQGEGSWNKKRVEQAQALLGFIKTLQAQTGDPDVLSVGDYNAYTEEAPILALRKGGLTHLNLKLAPEERYSFTYDARFGSLDHALATPELAQQVTGFGEWHINSDEPAFMDYPFLKVEGFVPDPYRSSDHDPLVIGLNLTAPTVALAPRKVGVKAPLAKSPLVKIPNAKPKVVPAKKATQVAMKAKRR